jgi:hypothetical protein
MIIMGAYMAAKDQKEPHKDFFHIEIDKMKWLERI